MADAHRRGQGAGGGASDDAAGRRSMETFNSQLGNAAVLADHKIPLAIGTGFEGYVPKTRVLRYEAAMAMVNGLGRERALAAITLDAAKHPRHRRPRSAASSRARSPTWCCTTATRSSTPRT